jgi:hypothetical protein
MVINRNMLPSEMAQSSDIKVIAPGQDKKPVLAKNIEYAHEKCFPTIFGGQPIKYTPPSHLTRHYKAADF